MEHSSTSTGNGENATRVASIQNDDDGWTPTVRVGTARNAIGVIKGGGR